MSADERGMRMPTVPTGGGLTTVENSGWDSAASRQRRASAGTMGIRRRARRQRTQEFPKRYRASADGLHAAGEELVRLVEMHHAYASQPTITPIWQGYIDQKAAAVSAQRLIIKSLAGTLANSPPTGRSKERFQ